MLEFNFSNPFPALETDRLMLRQVTLHDAEDMFSLRTNEDTMKYINKPKPKVVADVIELINRMNELTERIQWAITIKEQPKLIGTIGYHRVEKDHYRAEVGYMI